MRRGYVICPKCGGIGIVTLDSGKKARCSFCHSSGEVPKEKTMQTNEEWFCGLSTEEKAEVLYKFYCDGRNDELQVYVSINANSFKEWLKQPHREE